MPKEDAPSSSELDLNNYTSRKSFVQGLLDFALLMANGAQLKYLLTVGDVHPFYDILLVLIGTSISLQLFHAVIIVSLGVLYNINKTEEQRSSNIINNVLLCISVVSVVINIIISAFDMRNQSLRRTT